MDIPYFSIIVPVYNVEKYLKKCIDSLLEQTFDDYEIILINDGSTDNSLQICKGYAEDNEKIRLIDQENKGLFIARRNGIRASTGKYIVHVDSDDCCDVHLLEELQKIFDRTDVDAIIYNYSVIDESGGIIKKNPAEFEDRVFTREDKSKLFRKMLETASMNNIWIKSAKRELVNPDGDYSSFAQVMMGEDVVHSLDIISNSKRLYYTGQALYLYRVIDGSMSRKYKVSYIFDYIKVRKYFFDTLTRAEMDELIPLMLNKYYHGITNYLYKCAALTSSKREYSAIYTKALELSESYYGIIKSPPRYIKWRDRILFSFSNPRFYVILKSFSKKYFKGAVS